MKRLIIAVVALALVVGVVIGGLTASPFGASANPDPPNPGHSWSQIGDLPGTMWHSNNDGPGSGLDADLLDGAEASALEESDEIDGDIAAHAGNSSAHHTKTTDASDIVSGTMAPERIEGTAWTSLNDGSGGGLDADLLDGLNSDQIQDADDYVSSAGNADTVDGLHANEIHDADDYVSNAGYASTAGALTRLGFSTTAVDSTGVVGEYTSVTVGTDGLPIISYYDSTNGDLKVAHCGNAACSAGNTVTTVDSTGTVGLYTSVTVGADGLPLISYYDSTNGDLKVAHCGNADCSAGNTSITVASSGNIGLFTSVTVGTDGLPLISYYDSTNGELEVAHCGNADCSAGNTITTVDNTGGTGTVGEFSSLTVGADGLPLVSYYHWTNGDLKVAHCGNADCSAGNAIITVDSTGDVGEYTSVTVGTDGLPLVSYYDHTNGDLKVARCLIADCSLPGTITTVDSTGDVGRSTAVTVGADGLPLVSYVDGTNFDLKVAHCGNADCSAGNTITTVDSASAVGWYTSVTVGADGLPLISYYDSTNGDLKVAHCSNRFCVPYHRPR